MLLYKYHLFSVDKESKYVNIRCLVDKTKKKEVKITYYPTDKIVVDFSSKPLQRSIFILHYNIIQHISEKDFNLYKNWYYKVLKRYKLQDNFEIDLEGLQR